MNNFVVNNQAGIIYRPYKILHTSLHAQTCILYSSIPFFNMSTYTHTHLHARTHTCMQQCTHTHTHSSMNHSESDSQLWKLWWLKGKCHQTNPVTHLNWLGSTCNFSTTACILLVHKQSPVHPGNLSGSFIQQWFYLHHSFANLYLCSIIFFSFKWLWPSSENNLSDVHYLTGVQLAKSNSKQELCTANVTNLTFI